MPIVDRTWGISTSSGRCPFILFCSPVTYIYLLLPNLKLILVATLDRLEVSHEPWNFLEKIIRIPLQERAWKQLVTLDTIHWYCEGPKPKDFACRQLLCNIFMIIYSSFFILFEKFCLTPSSHSPWHRNG